MTCECEQLNIPDPTTCVEDGDCTNCIETWNTTTCLCDIVPTVLGCTNPTASNYDPNATCDDGSCMTGPCPDPGTCDDGDCSNGEEIWDFTLCECITINIPDPTTCVDDGDCSNGEETWNTMTCECEQLNIPDPTTCVDDGDCSNGEETWNTTTCECEQLNIPNPTTCIDDGDCSNGEETWNTMTCECEQLNIPDPTTCVDDGDCTNGIETWNATNCECESIPVDCSNSPTSLMPCDDGDDCTENDMQLVLDCDNSPCGPCQGTIATVGAPQINSVSICQNETLPSINATGSGNSFLWFDADPNSGATPIFTGNGFQPIIDTSIPSSFDFWVIESINNCDGEESLFTVTVDANPTVDAGQDLTLDCDNNGITLEGNSSSINANVSWVGPDPNMNTQVLNPAVTVAGTYQLTVTDNANNCFATDEVTIFDTDEIFASNDVMLLQGMNSTIIEVLANDDLQGYSNIDLTILNSPNGDVEVLNDGTLQYTANPSFVGIDEISYQICVVECPDICAEATVQVTVISEEIVVPDAFSPNGDNRNDTWVIPGIENYPNNQLTVINRWGSVLFDAKPYNNDWDGTNTKGKDLPEGTYYFILRLDVVEEAPISGSITIVR